MIPRDYYLSHGITAATLTRFGITANETVITIPIRDEQDQLSFRKYRHLDFDVTNKKTQKFSYDAGAHACLFNTSCLAAASDVFVTEGEFDAMRLAQEGYAAVSNTSGSGTFKQEWADQLQGKRVFIVYDTDEAGQLGAQKVLGFLPTAINLVLPSDSKDVCEFFLKYTKADFQKIVTGLIQKNTVTYQDLCTVFDKWLLLPDKHVIQILLATLISHFFSTDPLWMFFVAPPSGSKTEIISTIASLPFAHMLSDLTENTLASGMPVKKNLEPSLIMQLTNHVLIMKDFTTVLNMRPEAKAMILSQLREIYDGRYSKTFGTGKRVEWNGRLTFIAGVTSIIDTHSTIFQIMGERFVMYRIPQSPNKEVAKKALSTYGHEKQMRSELSSAIQKYFLSIDIPKSDELILPEPILDALASLSSFIVIARSGLVRDQFRRDLIYIPETEAPSRLAKQLGTLIKALCVLGGRTTVNWSDYFLTLRVALDVIPSNRSKHLVALSEELSSTTTITLSHKTNYSKSGSELIMEDLTALQLVAATLDSYGGNTRWELSAQSLDLFKDILPVYDPEIDQVFPKGSSYRPLIDKILERPAEMTAVHKAFDLPEIL